MKAGSFAGAAALLIAGVTAQSSSLPVSYTTVTYDVCPTSVVQSLVTVTNGVTVTYCPECNTKNLPATATAGGTVFTTVYTTTFLSVCPTSGTVPATYTVTEYCTGDKPSFSTQPGRIPDDFIVTVQTCNACGPTPVPVSITQPCGCKATNGVPVTNAMPMPTGPAGGNMSPPAGPNNCPGPNCPSPPAGGNNMSPPAGPNNCPGPNCPSPPAGGNNMSPPAAPVCPGPQCPQGGMASPSGTGYNNGKGPSASASCPGGANCPAPPKATYMGAAASSSVIGMGATVLAVGVAALAFGL